MNVLITGAGGFIGRSLVGRASSAGWNVRALVRRPTHFDAAVRSFEGDIRDGEVVSAAANECDVVVHLAGVVHSESATARDHEDITIGGTRNVLRALTGSRISRIVFVSSSAVYGTSDAPHVETENPSPTSDYGRAKLAAERLVMGSGIPWTIIRPAMVYGAECKGNLPRMVDAIARRRFVVPGRGDQVKSMVHVQNLVDALTLSVTHDGAVKSIFNVADEGDYSIRQISDLVSDALGRSRVPSAPLPLLHLAALAGDVVESLTGRRTPLDTKRLETLTSTSRVSIDAIKATLQYRSVRDFGSSIRELLAAR